MLGNLDISSFLKCLSFFTDLFLEQYDDSLLNIAVTIFRKTELVQKNPVTVNSFLILSKMKNQTEFLYFLPSLDLKRLEYYTIVKN